MRFHRWTGNITRSLEQYLATCPAQEPVELILMLQRRRPPVHLPTADGRRNHAQNRFQTDLQPAADYITKHGGEIIQTSWIGRAIRCRLPAAACKTVLNVHGVKRITRAKPEPAIP